MSAYFDSDQLLTALLDLKLGKELWRLGRDQGASLLQTVLPKLNLFYVTNPTHERSLAKIQDAFDKSKDNNENGVLTHLIYWSQDDDTSLKGLLSLGLNPDSKNKNGQSPVSLCSVKGRIKCAEALLPCRPDLATKTGAGHTVEELAKQGLKVKANSIVGYRVKICDDVEQLKKLQEGHGGWNDKMEKTAGQTGTVLSVNSNGDVTVQVSNQQWSFNIAAVSRASTTAEKQNPWESLISFWKTALEIDEFPSIAQLACEEKWWALKNLCRRRVVSAEGERLVKYQGRNVVEWAAYHGQVCLVQELCYLLKLERTVTVEKEANEGVSGSQLTSIPDDQQDDLLRGDVEMLKEGLSLCMSRCSEERETVRKQMASIEKQVQDLKLEVAGQIKGLNDQLAMMPTMISTAISAAIAGFAAGNRSDRTSS